MLRCFPAASLLAAPAAPSHAAATLLCAPRPIHRANALLPPLLRCLRVDLGPTLRPTSPADESSSLFVATAVAPSSGASLPPRLALSLLGPDPVHAEPPRTAARAARAICADDRLRLLGSQAVKEPASSPSLHRPHGSPPKPRRGPARRRRAIRRLLPQCARRARPRRGGRQRARGSGPRRRHRGPLVGGRRERQAAQVRGASPARVGLQGACYGGSCVVSGRVAA